MPPVMPTTRLNSEAMIRVPRKPNTAVKDRQDHDRARAEEHREETVRPARERSSHGEQRETRADDESQDQIQQASNLRARQGPHSSDDHDALLSKCPASAGPSCAGLGLRARSGPHASTQAVGSWELEIGSFSEVLSRIAEDLHPVRPAVGTVCDRSADLSQSRVQDVGAMTGRSHPGAHGRRGTSLSVRHVLRVRLPAIADGGESILWLGIARTRQRVSHLSHRRHLVRMELSGAHQRLAHRECRQAGLPAFRVGQRRQFRSGTRARWSPGFDARGPGGRRTASQDEQPDKKKSGTPVGHQSRGCKAGAAGRACSSR